MVRRSVFLVVVLACFGGFLAVQGCEGVRGTEPGATVLGAGAKLGEGAFSSYVQLDEEGVPEAIGLVFPSEALNTLPTDRSDEHRCFDHDADGTIESDPECLATHERVIPLPPEASRRSASTWRRAPRGSHVRSGSGGQVATICSCPP